MKLSRRRFALTLPALAAACGGSPEPVLYTIPMKPGPALSGGPKSVQLRDIALASYLDRKEIVRSSESFKLGVAGNDWWGEGPATMLSRVIVMGLNQRLSGSNVYAEGGAISPDANAVLGVNIQRLDLNASGQLELLAQAAVEFERPRRPSVARAFHITKTPPSDKVEGEVAAIADAVAELTDGLAQLLLQR
jgi:uncharacterized lipoprotein YmbA